MAVLDTETGKTLATPPIGKGVDACAFDPGSGEAFASCGDGTLTVVKETSPGKFEVVQTVKTRPGAAARWRSTRRPTRSTFQPPRIPDRRRPARRRRPVAKPGSFAVVWWCRRGKSKE